LKSFVVSIDYLDADTMSVDPPADAPEGTEEQPAQTLSRRRSTRPRTQVIPRPEGQRRGGRPPPRVRGSPQSSTLT
jgi:hypothetical protein